MKISRSLKWTVLFLVSILALYACDNKVESVVKSPSMQLGPIEKIKLKDSIQLRMSLNDAVKKLKAQSDFNDMTRLFPYQTIGKSVPNPVPYSGLELKLRVSFKDDVWSHINLMDLTFAPPEFNEAPNQLYAIKWERSAPGKVDLNYDAIAKFAKINNLNKASCELMPTNVDGAWGENAWVATWIQPYNSYNPNMEKRFVNRDRRCDYEIAVPNILPDAYINMHVTKWSMVLDIKMPLLEKRIEEYKESWKKSKTENSTKNFKF